MSIEVNNIILAGYDVSKYKKMKLKNLLKNTIP